MEIWLATINGWDGRSIVGVYSNPNIALKFSAEYLTEEDFGNAPKLHIKLETKEIITYQIEGSSEVVVIRKMEIDK